MLCSSTLLSLLAPSSKGAARPTSPSATPPRAARRARGHARAERARTLGCAAAVLLLLGGVSGCGEPFSATGGNGTGGSGASSTSTGAGGGGGSTAGSRCAPVGVIDDFDGPALSDTWYAWDPLLTSVQNGRLLLKTTDVAAYAGVHTTETYDLTGRSIWLDLPVALPASVDGSTHLRIGDTNNWTGTTAENLELAIVIESIEARYRLGGETTVLDKATYDPEAHRCLRIRESSGTTYLETSPDGLQWTTLGSHSRPHWIDASVIALQAGTWQANQGSHVVEFEAVGVVDD